MCAENDKKEITLHDIKQDIESLRADMKEMKLESKGTGVVTQLAFAVTLIGIGLFFMQYSPTTYMQYFFMILGIILGVWAIISYCRARR